MSRYPREYSLVTVTFADGEVKTYVISAGAGISSYLMREAGATGVLTMRNDDEKRAICVPLANIRDIQFEPYDQNAIVEPEEVPL